MKHSPKIGRCIVVYWQDIHTDSGWAEPSESPGLAECISVGFVTHVDARSVSLAATIGTDPASGHHETNMRQCIPLGCVTRWEYLRRMSGGAVRPKAAKETLDG